MRLRLISAGIILMSANAYAETNLAQQLSVCAIKTDKLERLACYDQLAANAKPSTIVTTNEPLAVPTNVPTQVPTSVTPTPVVTAQVDKVSAFGLTKKTEKQIEKLYFEVSKVKKGPYGELVITLNNGQVWKQSNPDNYRLKKGQRIFIQAGALSSFFLGSDDRNATTRVKRLK
ncbi:hypothetical protein ACWXWU_01270 [Shewanella sp. A14]